MFPSSRASLWPCIICGVLTIATLSIQYYASSGCAASRAAGTRLGGRQVSDQMCCPVGRIISVVGFTLTSIFGIWGIHSARQALDAALGQCCCCARCACGAGRAAVVAFAVTCGGLCGIGIFDLCWTATVHAFAALFFFGGGYVLVGILCFSRKDGFLLVRVYKHRAVLPLLALAAIPVARLDPLTGEWLAIAAIAFATCVLQFDIQRGEDLSRADCEVAFEHAPLPSPSTSPPSSEGPKMLVSPSSDLPLEP